MPRFKKISKTIEDEDDKKEHANEETEKLLLDTSGKKIA